MRSTGNSGLVDDGQVFAAAFAIPACDFLFFCFGPNATEGIDGEQHVAR